jgi:NAD(P)-dependent dehydrogenase (short-subunit alcohol dehydrogenase family)
MIKIDLSGKTVLITGGTQGIGLAAALKFAESGAKLFLTYKWGSADEGELYERFDRIGEQRPTLIQADVSVDADTDALLEQLGEETDGVDVFISNVGVALRTLELQDYKKQSLFKSLEYSTWPLIEYTRRIEGRFGRFPRHIVGISSDGPDHFYTGYDFVAASKALLEFFARYLSARLFKEGSRVNVIRFGTVRTDSFNMIFGEDFFRFMREEGMSDEMMLKLEDCGNTIVALCSGLLDAINGQIISVDLGLPFQDNSMMRYLRGKDDLEQVPPDS